MIPEPDIRHHKLCKADKLVIIASDGVWEFLTNQSVSDMVLKFSEPLEACRALYPT